MYHARDRRQTHAKFWTETRSVEPFGVHGRKILKMYRDTRQEGVAVSQLAQDSDK
jgi:hypothetical protein